MRKYDCFVCGKQGLSNNEIGLNKKLLDHTVRQLYCVECLAGFLEVTTEELLDKIEDFKENGCPLFD